MSVTGRPLISIIAAVDQGGVIGKDNALPWRLPADLRWFKEKTIGKPLIMGRETCVSIGRPLPDRTNIVLSRAWKSAPPGFLLAGSPGEAMELAGSAPEVMIAGGAQVFAEYLPKAGRMYLTEVAHRFDGDTFFPKFDRSQWVERYRAEHPRDAKNAWPMTFLVLERNPAG